MNWFKKNKTKKRDFSIILSNNSEFYNKMNLFKDGQIQDNFELPKVFTVAFIIVYSPNPTALWQDSNIELENKIYKLNLYYKQSENQILIYNFEKGYLAPLKLKIDTSQDVIFNVPNKTSLSVNFSVI